MIVLYVRSACFGCGRELLLRNRGVFSEMCDACDCEAGVEEDVRAEVEISA